MKHAEPGATIPHQRPVAHTTTPIAHGATVDPHAVGVPTTSPPQAGTRMTIYQLTAMFSGTTVRQEQITAPSRTDAITTFITTFTPTEHRDVQHIWCAPK